MKNLEKRYIQSELRADEDPTSRRVFGLAIPVESKSQLLYGEFYETIVRDAVNEDLINRNDVKVYLNHDSSQGTFARSKYGEGTLKFSITDRGLEFSFDAPKTVLGDVLLEGIRRHDYDSMSFAFWPNDVEWVDNADGTTDRYIRSISMLDEISILSVAPAYLDTDVECRAFEEHKKEVEENKRKAEEEQAKAEEERKQEISQKLDTLEQSFNELFNDIDL